ncbi:MAG: META domain-containing protein [Muribaculaceae bacterium]
MKANIPSLRHHLAILICGALISCTSSCSLFEKVPSVRGDAGTVAARPAQQPVATPPIPGPEAITEPQIEPTPTDTAEALPPAQTLQQTAPDRKPDAKADAYISDDDDNAATARLREMLAGEWLIVKAGTEDIAEEDDMPYINFDPAENRYYAYNGCNYLNGAIIIDEHHVTFANSISTMRYCADKGYDVAILTALNDNKPMRITIRQSDGASFIDLYGGSKDTSLTLRRHNMEFLNGHWRVTEINGNAPEVAADIFFDIAELKIHGNTGCNYFNGVIYIDPSHGNAIDFSQMGVTRMACPNTQQETAMLVALEQTVTATRLSSSTAQLADRNGKVLIKLQRIPLDSDQQQ